MLGGLIALPSFPCLADGAEMSMNKVLAQFTPYAEQTQADWHVPGMAIAIVQNGQIIYARGFGKRNAQGAPVTPDTIFDIASLTKSFTATLLAMQIDEGKYSWDTKVLKLYPQFKLYSSETTKEFEVQDLMVHDSGLPPDATDALGNFGYSTADTIYALRFIQPIAPFRTAFDYQDIFPMLAAEIIQQVGGENYTTILHQSIFSPLHMDNSYLDSEEKLYQLKNVAQPFVYFSGKEYPYPMNPPYLAELRALQKDAGGSGGIHSSAVDMAKWLIFNINNGAIGNTQLISVKNMDFIHAPQNLIKTSTRDVRLNGEAEQLYSQGWFIDKEEYKPYTVLYHPGGGTGMHALMAYIPEEKIGIVILTNTWGNQVPEALYRRFFDLYFHEKPLQNWSEIYLQENAKASAAQSASSKPDQCQTIKEPSLEQYVGTYYNPVYGNILMSKQGDHLTLTIGPIGMQWQLTYCQNNVLQAYWPNPYGMPFPMLPSGQDLIQFTAGPNDTVQTMTIPYLNGDGSGVFTKK